MRWQRAVAGDDRHTEPPLCFADDLVAAESRAPMDTASAPDRPMLIAGLRLQDGAMRLGGVRPSNRPTPADTGIPGASRSSKWCRSWT
jgi:hypothetical protein